jgi:thiol-disulfide isomerase/thioredoxin
MTALRSLLALGVLVGISVCAGPAQDKKVTLTPVKYDGLKQEVLKHRGKVVVVDFWATNCPPCRKALPHYIELQKKHAADGLVVITVSVDPMTKLARANEVLTELESPLRNLLLDEPVDMWSQKLDASSLPFAFVFDRRGKWVRFRASDYEKNNNPMDYEPDVMKTVARLLSEK